MLLVAGIVLGLAVGVLRLKFGVRKALARREDSRAGLGDILDGFVSLVIVGALLWTALGWRWTTLGLVVYVFLLILLGASSFLITWREWRRTPR